MKSWFFSSVVIMISFFKNVLQESLPNEMKYKKTKRKLIKTVPYEDPSINKCLNIFLFRVVG